MSWEIVKIIVVVITVFFSGSFAAAETALFSLPRYRVLSLARRSRAGIIVERLRSNPQRLILDIIVGDFLLLVFISILVSSIVSNLFVEAYRTLAMFAFSIVLVIVGELIPKGLAMRVPEESSLFLAPILNNFSKVAKPFRFLLSKISGILMPESLFTESMEKDVDLKKIIEMVDVGIKQGVFDRTEGVLVEGLLRLKETRAEDVMKRRPDLVMLSVDETVSDVLELVRREGYSRYPVYDGDEANIVGYVHFSDIVPWMNSQDLKVRDLMHTISYFPETTHVFDIMEEMRLTGRHIVVIVDEYGDCEGIITFEDIISRFLGDIGRVEVEEGRGYTLIGTGQYVVDGSVSLEEVSKILDVELGSEHSKTIAGYIAEIAGEIPHRGEIIRVEGHEVFILDASPTKVERILIRRIEND